MFTSSSSLGSRRPSANAYHDIGATTSLDGASPHKLVSLLYSALATQVATARGALSRRDIPAKARAISHAARIVDEGLRMPLDLAQGGAIAANLADLYEYLIQQLTQANLKSDDATLAECARLIETLREGWDGIAAQVGEPARAAA
ncbi:MAG: flagellar export chaperone FliS [Burkholderiaceae bacterium]